MSSASTNHVPKILQGAWRRSWIRFVDGTVDDTSIVLWLQFEREMVDVRFTADRAELASRGGLASCDLADVLRLADSDSSSGFTTCTGVELNDDGRRTATAEWHSPVDDGAVSFQPFTSFPEPGRLSWNDDGTVMMEHAPSGDYIEEWHLVPGTAGGAGSIKRHDDGTQQFTMGRLVVEVIDRRSMLDRTVTLLDQIHDAADLDTARALVDCEFTLAERTSAGEAPVIVASTHPWRSGQPLEHR